MIFHLPLNLAARFPKTDDNLLIESLVLFSNRFLEYVADFISALYVQHDPPGGTSQYLSVTSGK